MSTELNERMRAMIIPPQMRKLPVSPEGYPTPWFVAWIDGKPDFRVIDTPKIGRAVKEKRCWLCGGPLGQYNKAFVIGPMCAINRVISEPPSHCECAEFSARACPFLSQPRMQRNEKDLPPDVNAAAGFAIKRNPGAICVWVTKTYRPFRAHAGDDGILFQLGDPVETLWFANGREATRAEVLQSIDSGYPLLMELAEQQGAAAIAELERRRREAMPLLPVA
jgi:hypothetical protein